MAEDCANEGLDPEASERETAKVFYWNFALWELEKPNWVRFAPLERRNGAEKGDYELFASFFSHNCFELPVDEIFDLLPKEDCLEVVTSAGEFVIRGNTALTVSVTRRVLVESTMDSIEVDATDIRYWEGNFEYFERAWETASDRGREAMQPVRDELQRRLLLEQDRNGEMAEQQGVSVAQDALVNAALRYCDGAYGRADDMNWLILIRAANNYKSALAEAALTEPSPVYGLKLLTPEGTSLSRDYPRITYPVGEWVTAPGNGSYVAMTYHVTIPLGMNTSGFYGSDPKALSPQCNDSIAQDDCKRKGNSSSGCGVLLAQFECEEPTGNFAPRGVVCFRRLRRLAEIDMEWVKTLSKEMRMSVGAFGTDLQQTALLNDPDPNVRWTIAIHGNTQHRDALLSDSDSEVRFAVAYYGTDAHRKALKNDPVEDVRHVARSQLTSSTRLERR